MSASKPSPSTREPAVPYAARGAVGGVRGGASIEHYLHAASALERDHMLERDALNVRARSPLVTPQREQLADVRHRETEVARAADEAQHMHVLVGVEAIARVRAPRRRQQADRLVVADHLRRHAGGPGCIANVQHFHGVVLATLADAFIRSPC